MKILLTGGGSGGHTMPLVAVADELKKKKNVKLIVIAEKVRNAEPPIRQTKTYYIPAGKLRRYHGEGLKQLLDFETVRLNISDTLKVLRGAIKAYQILIKEKPDVVFIKGGYVSLPVGFASWLRGIPYVTHDSDAIPGLTNRLLSKGAAINMTGFPTDFYSYSREKSVHSGIPIRSEFQDLSKAKARKKLGIPLHQKRILLMGGSLGARKMNNAFVHISSQLSQIADVLHLTGTGEYESVMQALSAQNNAQSKYKAVDYLTDTMALELAAADVVVTRAGATSLAELAALKKAIVVVPNPLLAEGHQLKNAEIISSYDAGIILQEDQFVKDPNILIAILDRLINDSKQRKWLGDNLHKLFDTQAAEQISKHLLLTGKK